MTAEEFKNSIEDYVLGKLTPEQEQDVRSFLEAHPEHKEGLAIWEDIKVGLDQRDEEPSAAMDARFYNFLEAQKKDDGKVVSLTHNKPSIFARNPILMPLLAASIMLLFGFFLGNQWNKTDANPVQTKYVDMDIEESRQETEDVRTQLVMSLADDDSASKRLQAVSEASKFDNATDKVIVALFKMLNTDSNVNVRLAAVASLSKYVDNPKVREGLVMSITKQESPLVQIALAELMVTLKEQKSINSMEALLQKPDINDAARQKLEESIKKII